jgi:hypothetical protein
MLQIHPCVVLALREVVYISMTREPGDLRLVLPRTDSENFNNTPVTLRSPCVVGC